MGNDGRHVNAYLSTKKPHFLQKVISYRQTFNDGFKPRFSSNISVFIRKINLEYSQPCVMLYASNGNGRCLIRCQNPTDLATSLRQLADILTSNLWCDLWLQMESTADGILANNFVHDEQFIDLGQNEQKR